MQRLRAVIAEYGRWKELELYVNRIEGHLESDFSTSIENAKALLEAVGKEICQCKGTTVEQTASVNNVLRKAFIALGYPNDGLVNSISGAIATIGQRVGEIRNQISPTSHGKSLEELRQRNNSVDIMTREFLIDSTILVAVFLIRAFEECQERSAVPHRTPPRVAPVPGFEECEEFNNQWDESFGEFQMGEYLFTASEILYGLDPQAYCTEHQAFLGNLPNGSEDLT